MLVSLFFDLQASLVTYLTETFKVNAYLKKTLPKKNAHNNGFRKIWWSLWAGGIPKIRACIEDRGTVDG